MKHSYLLFLLLFSILSFTGRAEDPCHVTCKQNMPITLGPNCQYTLQPNDILDYPPPYCNYIINVYNSNNQPIGPTVNQTHVGQTLNVKVSYGSWFCWASIIVYSGGGGGGPVAICDVNTQVSLGSDGTAIVGWETFDDGSYVACGQVSHIKVRRDVPGWCPPNVVDDTQFRDYVQFCCEDVANSPVKVILRVYDYYGNYNDCWANAWVEDHLTPHIYCPPDITVSCDYPINYNNLSEFGSVQMSQSQVQPIYINDPVYYPNGGFAGYDGYVGGGACGGNYWVFDSYWTDIQQCGTGTIYRKFIIENTPYFCIQKIYVRNKYPFNGYNIHWPPDVELPNCGPNDLDPSTTGKPTWYNTDCSLLASTYKDEVFTIVPDACFKILRHWSVIDWCTFEPNHPYNKGRWDYTQVIKLKNSDAPTFPHCYDTTFCTTDVYDCYGKAPLKGWAYDDCTADSLLKWHWCIDLWNDGVGQYQGQYDVQGHTRNATDYYPFGTHKILWRVEDLCGNFNTCSYLFTVEDCKKPSPICLGALSTVVMPASGMIELEAEFFDASSFDNCTKAKDLIFTFSDDVTHTSQIFDCNYIGTNEVQIWVTDEAGNQQYCTAYLILEDNFNVCPDTPMALVYGTVTTLDEEALLGSEVRLETGGVNIRNFELIQDDGLYSFGSFAEIDETTFPLTVSKNDDVLNGVSVLDLLLLQKHILQIRSIADPFTLLAADVNGDGLVDARDVLETKLVMLNKKSMFGRNASWLYMEDIAGVDPRALDYNTFEIVASTDAPVRLDLIGLKVGDLNGNAKLSLGGADTRSIRTMDVEDEFLSAEDAVLFPVTFESHVDGYLVDLELKEEFATVVQVYDQDMNVIPFEYNEGQLQVLFVDAAGELAANKQFFIKAEIHQAAWLSEVLSSGQGESSMVDENEEEFKLKLRFKGNGQVAAAPMEVKLLPNPFRSETQIVIKNEFESDGFVEILDQTGKVLRKYNVRSDDDVVRIKLLGDELPASGLYWIKAQIGERVEVEKLMHLK